MTADIRQGVLEVRPEGYGFLRDPNQNFRANPDDPFVAKGMIKSNHLRPGVLVEAEMGTAPPGKRSAPIRRIVSCNGLPIDAYKQLPDIKSLTSIDPEEQMVMTLSEKDRTGWAIDHFTPMGKGQRGLIVSPPKAGKTTILKHIARATRANHPDVSVIVLLIDERPEEITDFQRDLDGVLVLHSSADQDPDNHLRITNLTMNMAIRRTEAGEDVLVLIDSLTRMGRSYNVETNSRGRTLSGGLGANALELPRRFFGAARNVEHGGSLTIMASILVDTGSRMDEVIFQEFKGTGNLDLVLSRECAERRLFPAFNIRESGTRKDHKILDEEKLEEANLLRRRVAGMKPWEALEEVLEAFHSRV